MGEPFKPWWTPPFQVIETEGGGLIKDAAGNGLFSQMPRMQAQWLCARLNAAPPAEGEREAFLRWYTEDYTLAQGREGAEEAFKAGAAWQARSTAPKSAPGDAAKRAAEEIARNPREIILGDGLDATAIAAIIARHCPASGVDEGLEAAAVMLEQERDEIRHAALTCADLHANEIADIRMRCTEYDRIAAAFRRAKKGQP